MKTPSPLFPFAHRHILQTALPLGGIGAGCVCFNGHGGLQDFALYNQPATSALADGWHTQEAAFALLRIEGAKPVTRLVEGPFPAGKIYDQGLQGQGYRHGGHEGLPRFRRARFDSGYPFGRVRLSDTDVPLDVEVIAWNPFIPLDDADSGLPCAILEYTLKNPTRHSIAFQFSYHLSHLAGGTAAEWRNSRNRVVSGKGIFFHNTEDPGSEKYGSASLTVIGHRPKIKAMWLRGGWFDAVSALWRECDGGANSPSTKARMSRACSGDATAAPCSCRESCRRAAKSRSPSLITWHFPNSNVRRGSAEGDFRGSGRPFPPGLLQRPHWKTFLLVAMGGRGAPWRCTCIASTTTPARAHGGFPARAARFDAAAGSA